MIALILEPVELGMTVIEQDSDVWTIQRLSPQLWEEVCKKKSEVQWTDLMDWALCKLQNYGITKDDIANNLKEIPFTNEMRRVLLDLKERHIPVILLSDANRFYIDAILTSVGVIDCITEIVTNPSYIDDQGRLRVRRHVPVDAPQHNCPNECAANLCKGQEMDRLIEKYSKRFDLDHSDNAFKVAYAGDGKNDFCASTRLKPCTDIFFMRKGKGLDDYLNKRPEERNKIRSMVVDWWTPQTVMDVMPKYFDGTFRPQQQLSRGESNEHLANEEHEEKATTAFDTTSAKISDATTCKA
ncbi:putative phosphatase-domain-containing protein [Mycotypha africana]|uniref:putative phosphatase-domain-containing protein n=1 Tax=Mycotypha africana TaxID=64632 RepID=UPI002300502F|nr:putative phosphatase-domain-containing protein [Mycotypha africana]KAI8971746.1 putative phosphatase-domain-containing protein [Mycotypha africana]